MKIAYLVTAVLLATTPSMADDWRSKELRNINSVERSTDAALEAMKQFEQDCMIARLLVENYEWLAELINQNLCGQPEGIKYRLHFAREKIHEANVDHERLHTHAEPLPEEITRFDSDLDPMTRGPNYIRGSLEEMRNLAQINKRVLADPASAIHEMEGK
jgi:hypothetical protein